MGFCLLNFDGSPHLSVGRLGVPTCGWEDYMLRCMVSIAMRYDMCELPMWLVQWLFLLWKCSRRDHAGILPNPYIFPPHLKMRQCAQWHPHIGIMRGLYQIPTFSPPHLKIRQCAQWHPHIRITPGILPNPYYIFPTTSQPMTVWSMTVMGSHAACVCNKHTLICTSEAINYRVC